MRNHAPSEYIETIGEKRVQSASKGRNQWLVLKKFDGKRVINFIEAAKIATRRQPPGKYQDRNWWDRELDYRLKHFVIRIVQRSSDAAGGTPGEPDFRRESPPPAPETPSLPTEVMPRLLPRTRSGLYLVTLNNVEPISANAHDPRIADTSIKVNRDHCKFGKAPNLEARKQNYRKTFGEQNVNFLSIAEVAPNDVDRAERLVSDRLGRHRAERPSGRVTEWMHGI